MRQYIRHPSDVPIRYSLTDLAKQEAEQLKDISEGGLCFSAQAALQPGAKVQIEIPIEDPPFAAEGTVIWCDKLDDHYEIGVQFADDNEQFKLRMVEQLCYIERYKKDILINEGRELTGEEAALEWIAKHADEFPR